MRGKYVFRDYDRTTTLQVIPILNLSVRALERTKTKKYQVTFSFLHSHEHLDRFHGGVCNGKKKEASNADRRWLFDSHD